jgi:hypothetical protein
LHKCKSYYSGYKSKKNPYLTRGYGSRKARREATKICMPLQRRGHAEDAGILLEFPVTTGISERWIYRGREVLSFFSPKAS